MTITDGITFNKLSDQKFIDVVKVKLINPLQYVPAEENKSGAEINSRPKNIFTADHRKPMKGLLEHGGPVAEIDKCF